jgi:hypothetical protein
MGRSGRNLAIGLSLIAGMAIGGGALVKAQQGQNTVHAESATVPPPDAEEAPPPDAALSGAVVIPPSPPAEAADVEPAPQASA